jgi:O-antigen ligase
VLKAFAWFFVIVSVECLFATNPEKAIEFWAGTYWKIGAMTLVLAWVISGVRDLRLIHRCIVFSGILVASVAIYNKLHGIGLVEGTRVTIGRDLNSALGDPNDLASVLLLPLSFAGGLLVFRPSWLDTALAGLAVPTCLIAILFTESRGGFLGVLALLAVCVTQFIRTVRRARSRVIISALGVALAFAIYAGMGIGERVAKEPDSEVLDESATGRVEAWTAALSMTATRPLTGVGLHNFTANYLLHKHALGEAASAVAVGGADRSGKIRAVHSMWLEVLAETGLPGLSIFVIMIAAAVLAAVRSLKQTGTDGAAVIKATGLALVAGLVGFGVAGSFLTHAFTWQIQFLVALAAGISRVTQSAPEMGIHKAEPLPLISGVSAG